MAVLITRDAELTQSKHWPVGFPYMHLHLSSQSLPVRIVKAPMEIMGVESKCQGICALMTKSEISC